MGTKAKSDIVKMVNNEVELLQILDKSSAVSAFGSHTHGEITTEKIEGVGGVVMKINCKHRLVYLTSIPQVVKQPKAKEPKPPKVKPPKPPKVKKVKQPRPPKVKTGNKTKYKINVIDPITGDMVFVAQTYVLVAEYLGVTPDSVSYAYKTGGKCKGYIIKKNNKPCRRLTSFRKRNVNIFQTNAKRDSSYIVDLNGDQSEPKR